MGKKSSKKKPHTPSMPWDQGPQTAAAQALTVEEAATFRDPDTGKQVNPNGVKRRRRQSLVERFMQRGLISGAQYLSALDLKAAHTAQAADSEGVVVDFTRDPEDAVVSLIDRQAKYRAMRAAISPAVWQIVENVVIHERAIKSGQTRGRRVVLAMAQLRLGLDQLSKHLRR